MISFSNKNPTSQNSPSSESITLPDINHCMVSTIGNWVLSDFELKKIFFEQEAPWQRRHREVPFWRSGASTGGWRRPCRRRPGWCRTSRRRPRWPPAGREAWRWPEWWCQEYLLTPPSGWSSCTRPKTSLAACLGRWCAWCGRQRGQLRDWKEQDQFVFQRGSMVLNV